MLLMCFFFWLSRYSKYNIVFDSFKRPFSDNLPRVYPVPAIGVWGICGGIKPELLSCYCKNVCGSRRVSCVSVEPIFVKRAPTLQPGGDECFSQKAVWTRHSFISTGHNRNRDCQTSVVKSRFKNALGWHI